MPALVAGIHVFLHFVNTKQDVDGRDKPRHDVEGAFLNKPPPLALPETAHD